MISDRYVLTAAHCVHRKTQRSVQVVLGEHDWTSADEAATLRLQVIEILRHPRFGERATFDYDFALLKLSQPIEWSRHPGVRPACMPERYIGSNIQG